MPNVEFTDLLGVMVIGFAAPLVLGYVPWLRVPAVVLEIVLGIVVGPSVLGWLAADLPVQIVALLGLAMLLFLAGLEIDVPALRGRLLTVSLAGYAVSIGVGAMAGIGLAAVGWVDDPFLLAVTLSATSLGLVVAVLKDAEAVGGGWARRWWPPRRSPTSLPSWCCRWRSRRREATPERASCCW